MHVVLRRHRERHTHVYCPRTSVYCPRTSVYCPRTSVYCHSTSVYCHSTYVYCHEVPMKHFSRFSRSEEAPWTSRPDIVSEVFVSLDPGMVLEHGARGCWSMNE